MRTYAQYCPIARASELLAERWTPIIVRNLFAGCTTYGEIAAGAPGVPRSLLTQRLRQLRAAGVVEMRPKKSGRGMAYHLTEAGRDLWRVLEPLGAWGEQWLELRDEHTNPRFLLWSWCTAYLARERLPEQRVVVRFEFTDQPVNERRAWLVIDRQNAEVCDKPPGFDEDLVVQTDAWTLVRWHLGQLEWSDAVRDGSIRVTGPRQLARALPTWNRRHPVRSSTVPGRVALVPRPRGGWGGPPSADP